MRSMLALALVVGVAGVAHAVPCADSIGPGPVDVTKHVSPNAPTLPDIGVQRVITHPDALELVGAYFSSSIVRVQVEYTARSRPRRREVWTTPDRMTVCAPDALSSMVVHVTGFTANGVRSSTFGEAHPEGYVPPPYSAVPRPVSPLLAILTAAGMLMSIVFLVFYAVRGRTRIEVPTARARFRGVERPTLTKSR